MRRFKQRGTVGKNGTIEIQVPELVEGTPVEIIVLVEGESEDETDYLLSNSANRTKLMEAIERAENVENLVVISAEEWNEKYRG